MTMVLTCHIEPNKGVEQEDAAQFATNYTQSSYGMGGGPGGRQDGSGTSNSNNSPNAAISYTNAFPCGTLEPGRAGRTQSPAAAAKSLEALLIEIQDELGGVVKELREEIRELHSQVRSLSEQLEKLLKQQQREDKKLHRDGRKPIEQMVQEATIGSKGGKGRRKPCRTSRKSWGSSSPPNAAEKSEVARRREPRSQGSSSSRPEKPQARRQEPKSHQHQQEQHEDPEDWTVVQKKGRSGGKSAAQENRPKQKASYTE
ncbi:hypothetical protein ZHAS_00000158 [Anopheles sinensis]|uniref:Uncharacterized protein n=1 Tax=Anopheles sinensis TaxID=74873 RepID=A0A084V9X3_ANOSI|nr:hypothetical protein ZHAS_00000158 [Anopheles sinensis]